MFRHFIIISNDYLRKSRIALDIVEKDESYINRIGKIISEIMEKCDGEAPFSTHSILANGKEWEAVEEADAYFKNIKIIKDDEEFINRIMVNRKLKELDIKKYILCKSWCDPLELEDLYNLCCSEFLMASQLKFLDMALCEIRNEKEKVEKNNACKKNKGEE